MYLCMLWSYCLPFVIGLPLLLLALYFLRVCVFLLWFVFEPRCVSGNLFLAFFIVLVLLPFSCWTAAAFAICCCESMYSSAGPVDSVIERPKLGQVFEPFLKYHELRSTSRHAISWTCLTLLAPPHSVGGALGRFRFISWCQPMQNHAFEPNFCWVRSNV